MKNVLSGKLSIITTVFKSSAHIKAFFDEAEVVLSDIQCTNFEFIVVNDGSPDDSLQKLIEIKNSRSYSIVIVDFSRNYGHHNAIHAGLSIAEGDYFFLIDSDLETEPSILKNFVNVMNSSDCDVVYGYQERRKGGLFEKLSGKVFWRVFNFLSNSQIQENILTERLMSRKYVESLLTLNDKNLFLAGMMYWIGFTQMGIPILKRKRDGRTTYGIFKKVNLMFNAVSSYSSAPLVFMFYIGILVSLASFGVGIFYILKKILYPELILFGWTSIILTIIFGFGVLITCIGTIGIYLSKIFNQAINRPLYIIRNIIK